ncbi:carbamoyl-phosphate synthase (glutamine-hydrolyzing) small subunit [Candidatus Peregrinibacteria bacterium CG_4_9_14_0_2_um_filter_53_11]|nr:MAG: carbamoyl-phosphate synthase (glutamine-hydrolyzing) small subunit [Candidatus Peregrinibacteria bacterium CG_4_9_14_0_2_um_filter_53_11]
MRLILSDGTVFSGKPFGAAVGAQGEVVFNTGMVGYPESMTDPSYSGQILVLTYPLVGNYGVSSNKKDSQGIKEFFESNKISIRGLVVSEYSEDFNHWNGKQSLGDWMKQEGIPGITGIDTRALTQKLREHGVMLGQLVQEGAKPIEKLADPNESNLAGEASVKKPKEYIVKKRGGKTIIAIDTGMKNNILRSFFDRGVNVIRVPWNYDIWNGKYKFDGLFIANGPGDPAQLTATHELIKKAYEKKVPTFGICLGLQLMAIAAGAKTYKLKYGHRAQNQPVIDLQTKKCYLTSQNHGFAVKAQTLPKDWEIWMENINDGTVEGIRHKKLPFRAVQFHPEATPGPVDTAFLFDEFISSL